MSYITGKYIPRRTFLRGVGATVALPFMEAMVPAGRAWGAPAAEQFTRFIGVEESMGCAGWQRLGRRAAPLRAGEDGPRLRFHNGKPSEAPRGVPGLPDGRQPDRRQNGEFPDSRRDRRRPRSSVCGVPDPGPSAAQVGRGLPWEVAGSGPCGPLRTGYRAALAGAHHRAGWARRVRIQLPLRIRHDDRLGLSHRAASADRRSEGGFRAALRRW